MYRDIVDPRFTWANFSLEEQSKVIKAGRSNCRLDAEKLVSKMGRYGVEVIGAEEAWREALGMMRDANGGNKVDWVKDMAMGTVGCPGISWAMGVEGMTAGMGMDGKENRGPAGMLAQGKSMGNGSDGQEQEMRDVDGGMRVH